MPIELEGDQKLKDAADKDRMKELKGHFRSTLEFKRALLGGSLRTLVNRGIFIYYPHLFAK